ncbi:DNA adenine methylase [Ochrobactrum sp. RH2CCR150]|nr:DNA adenine methylase [Ochrobactrum sp. RH2CCR150]
MKPFLKWAGGKRWLARSAPQLFELKYERYLEPFLGSGAIFFHLLPNIAILSDSNKRLINLYQCLKESPSKILDQLKIHEKNHNDSYYYTIRSSQTDDRYVEAGIFLYLNRTCWNGLYRENMKGEFNVPRGTKDTIIFPDDNFLAISEALAGAEIKACDFSSVLKVARNGDLVFVDPPYTVKHNFNGFVKYNEKIFSWDDQVRLSHEIIEAVKRGASVILTNADHPSIHELYNGYGVRMSVERESVLAAKSNYRGRTTEAVFLFGQISTNDVSTGQKRFSLQPETDR